MALDTKRAIVQEVLYELFGGVPSNQSAISENFVLRKLNDRIAEAAVKSAFGAYNLDGCVCVDDVFNLTYSGLTLLTDTASGLKYVLLPAQPVGLPSGRAFNIWPPKNRGGIQQSTFKPITRGEVTYLRSLPVIKKIFHFVENGRLYIVDNANLAQYFDTINMSITSSGANDLSAILNLPDDMIATVKALTIQDCKQMLALADTTPIPASDAPEPRN